MIDDAEDLPMPPRLRQLADVIGVDAALRLCNARPGLRVYIPREPDRGHWIAELIGYDQMRALCAALPGQTPELPKCDDWHRAARDARIRAARAAGVSESEVALEHGLHPRQVRRINGREADDHPDLFGAYE